nr:RHS repeat-associated core domain-containing protein [Burkholderia lata]
MHYNRHRYYDPGSGRFVSKDPIGLAGGTNVYAYGPNPIEWVDPLRLAGNRANRRAGSILRDMDSSGGGHAYARHGAGTTMAQQEHRAKTGIPPDNPCPRRPRPINSTRFLSNIDQLDAIQRGIALMDANGTNTETFDMGRTVGEGYRAGGGCPETTKRVTVVRRNGNIVTAYPQL